MLSTLSSAQREPLVAVPDGDGLLLRHPLAGPVADDILRGVTTFAPLYVPDELGEAVSARAWLGAMLEAERALARAGALAGVVPEEAASVIAAACDVERYDWTTLLREGRDVGNPVEPLVRALVDHVGEEAGRYVHLGATSQDMVDTAAMLVARRCLGLVLSDLGRVADATAALAREHRDTPMAGRTMLQHAVPTTFGVKAAGLARRGARGGHAPLGCARAPSRGTARRRGRDAGGARRSGARRLCALRGRARPVGGDAALAHEPRSHRGARLRAGSGLHGRVEGRARPPAARADRGRRGARHGRRGRLLGDAPQAEPRRCDVGAGCRGARAARRPPC